MMKVTMMKRLFLLVAFIALGMVFLINQTANPVQADRHFPTANCFVLDGMFSACPDPGDEWADVSGTGFPEDGPFTSILRATQVDFDPDDEMDQVTHLALMYDEPGITTPLGPDDAVQVHLETVQDGALRQVNVSIFTNGTVMVSVDGVLQEEEGPPDTFRVRAEEIIHHSGKVSFGTSPADPINPHLTYELVVPLQGAMLSHVPGTPYSPLPLHWGSFVPPPPTQGLDHFKCYRVQAEPFSATVMLQDQFDLADQVIETVVVDKAHRFCNPVDKQVVRDDGGTGETTLIQNPAAHLKWYEIFDSVDRQQRQVAVSNQFVTDQILQIGQPRFLAVPTEKLTVNGEPVDSPRPPEHLDHFKCWEATEELPVGAVVNLQDQFNTESDLPVLEAFFLCNPTTKLHNNNETPVLNAPAHLVCYGIEGASPSAGLEVRNQFGSEQLTVQVADLLCVPSSKTELTTGPGDPDQTRAAFSPNLPALQTGASIDTDGDGVPNALDNCPNTLNPGQEDLNFNGIGDICEPGQQFNTAAFLDTGFGGPNTGITGQTRTGTAFDAVSVEDKLTVLASAKIERMGLDIEGALRCTMLLVQSQVALGLIDPDEAGPLVESIVKAAIPGDHFLGYKIETDEKFKPRKVFLADQFFANGDLFRVDKPDMLYTPADKKILPNEDQASLENVRDRRTHLKRYKVKGPKLKRHVVVLNQFGRFVGEVKGPKHLLVPTTKVLDSPTSNEVPGLPQGKVDHYLCYDFKRGKADEAVSIADQFGTADYRVLDVTRFCNPVAKAVAKDGVIEATNINQRNLHLMCFRVRGGDTVNQAVRTNNQFGPERLMVLDPKEVCVPSLKTVVEKDHPDQAQDDQAKKDKKKKR